MNNSKWIKIFKILSNNSAEIKKCLIKNIFDDNLREITISKTHNFKESFSKTGINDNIIYCGPSSYKEIEQIIFPQEWTINRKMKNEKLAPKTYNQNIENIKNLLISIGKTEIEITNGNLILYGYR